MVYVHFCSLRALVQIYRAGRKYRVIVRVESTAREPLNADRSSSYGCEILNIAIMKGGVTGISRKRAGDLNAVPVKRANIGVRYRRVDSVQQINSVGAIGAANFVDDATDAVVDRVAVLKTNRTARSKRRVRTRQPANIDGVQRSRRNATVRVEVNAARRVGGGLQKRLVHSIAFDGNIRRRRQSPGLNA